MTSRSLLRVLVQEHRRHRATLSRWADGSAAGQVTESDARRLALELAGQLMTEEAVVAPVISGVLAGDGLRDGRERDIAFCLHLLVRAGSHVADDDAFTAAALLACEAYDELTFGTEVEVLPYLHYVFDAGERQRLAELYPVASRLVSARFSRQDLPDTPVPIDHGFIRAVGRSGGP